MTTTTTITISLPTMSAAGVLRRQAVTLGTHLVVWGSARQARIATATRESALLPSNCTEAAAVRAGMLPR